MLEKNGDFSGNKWTSQQSARLRFSRSFPLISCSPASAQTWLSGALAFVLLPPTTTRLPLMVLAWTLRAGQSWAQGGAWCEDVSDPPLALVQHVRGEHATAQQHVWDRELARVPGVCPGSLVSAPWVGGLWGSSSPWPLCLNPLILSILSDGDELPYGRLVRLTQASVLFERKRVYGIVH